MPRDHTTKEGPSLSIREIDIRYLYFCGRAPIERFTCLSRSLSGLKKHDIERSELDGERELITPTFKLKRPQLKAFYAEELKRMYVQPPSKL